MKKSLILILATLMLLTSCDESGNKSETTTGGEDRVTTVSSNSDPDAKPSNSPSSNPTSSSPTSSNPTAPSSSTTDAPSSSNTDNEIVKKYTNLQISDSVSRIEITKDGIGRQCTAMEEAMDKDDLEAMGITCVDTLKLVYDIRYIGPLTKGSDTEFTVETIDMTMYLDGERSAEATSEYLTFIKTSMPDMYDTMKSMLEGYINPTTVGFMDEDDYNELIGATVRYSVANEKVSTLSIIYATSKQRIDVELYENGKEKSYKWYDEEGTLRDQEEFDSDGNCTLEFWMGKEGYTRKKENVYENGVLRASTEYQYDKKYSHSEYNENGKPTVFISYDDDGVEWKTITYEYSEDGGFTSTIHQRNLDGQFYKKSFSQYNSKAQKTLEIDYHEDETIYMRSEYTYDGEKTHVKVTVYDGNGDEQESHEYDIGYDINA